MAKTQQQRSADCADRRKARGEEELRMRTLAGTRQCLADLMRWHGIEEQGEAMTLMLHHLHALGPEGSAPYFAPPALHITALSKSVERKFIEKSLLMIRRDPGDEIVEPDPIWRKTDGGEDKRSIKASYPISTQGTTLLRPADRRIPLDNRPAQS